MSNAWVLWCYLLHITYIQMVHSEVIEECFKVPLTQHEKTCDLELNCNQKYTAHYERLQNSVQFRLTCPSDATLEIQDVIYSIPATLDNYCAPDCKSGQSCQCQCNKHISGIEKFCEYKLSKVDQDNLATQCQNKSSDNDEDYKLCVVEITKAKIDKQTCPQMAYECEKVIDGRSVNLCWSRWVKIDYECKGTLPQIWYILLGVGGGLVLLIIIVVIIRKVVYDRSERYDTSDTERQERPLTYSPVKKDDEYGDVKKFNKDSIKHTVPSVTYEDRAKENVNYKSAY